MRLEPFVLRGSSVQLEPLGHHHAPALLAAADRGRASFGYTPVPADLAAMERYISTLVTDAAADTAVPFVQRRVADDLVVGCTRFLNVIW